MGCGLKKLRPVSEEHSPGKIFSTLKRPQVETRAGPSYTYRFLDFVIGKDGGTSTLRLSSVRELPSQLLDLYRQGFVLAALHQFVLDQPWTSSNGLGPEHQLYRAILVCTNDGSERGASFKPHVLQMDQCLCADQEPTAEFIQGYVKKQVQDLADQGVLFVGFVHESQSASCRREPPHTQSSSLSLHSSPSSILGSLSSGTQDGPPRTGPTQDGPPRTGPTQDGPPQTGPTQDGPTQDGPPQTGPTQDGPTQDGPPQTGPTQDGPTQDGPTHCKNEEPVDCTAAGGGTEEESAPCGSEEEVQPTPGHRGNSLETDDDSPEQRRGISGELLALFDFPAVREPSVRFYTVKVPVQVTRAADGTVRGLDGPWLDHMTQHFSGGASLVHGHFCLGGLSDVESKSAESVFIFKEPSEFESECQAFDAIVVEQWTITQGLQVKADYVPLLQSLASFGWRLTCVLPTPVTRTNSDGTVSTKQMVFLQRPVLSRKKKDSKKLIFKSRSKPNKNCIKAKRSKNLDRDLDQDRPLSGGARDEATAAEKTKERTDMKENGLETVANSENQSVDRSEPNQELKPTAANQSVAGSQE